MSSSPKCERGKAKKTRSASLGWMDVSQCLCVSGQESFSHCQICVIPIWVSSLYSEFILSPSHTDTKKNSPWNKKRGTKIFKPVVTRRIQKNRLDGTYGKNLINNIFSVMLNITSGPLNGHRCLNKGLFSSPSTSSRKKEIYVIGTKSSNAPLLKV